MKIAYQGESGAYSELAVIEYFGEVEVLPCESFEAVFEAVKSGKCEIGLIPIENSLTGGIQQNYDLLGQYPLYIIGEYILRIRHCLIGLLGVKIEEIKNAISHPQALAQCSGYLRSHHIKPEEAYDTAGSVKMVKETGRRDTAAIASRRAAELYGMQVLEEGIEDNLENYTRFLAVALEAILPNGEAKSSILFHLKNEPGALFKCLSFFGLRDIDITNIESRPRPGQPWEYSYFIDFVGPTAEDISAIPLEQLEGFASKVRLLGSYLRFNPDHIHPPPLSKNGSDQRPGIAV